MGLLFAIWLFVLFLFLARSELALCLQAFFLGFFCLFNLLVFGLKLGLGHARRAHGAPAAAQARPRGGAARQVVLPGEFVAAQPSSSYLNKCL